MPCYVAIIHSLQCQHKKMFKFHCTRGCDAVCAKPDLCVVINMRWMYRCRDCTSRRCRREKNVACAAMNIKNTELYGGWEPTEHTDVEVSDLSMVILQRRQNAELKRMELRHECLNEETESVVDWTYLYGKTATTLLMHDYKDEVVLMQHLQEIHDLRGVVPNGSIIIKDAIAEDLVPNIPKDISNEGGTYEMAKGTEDPSSAKQRNGAVQLYAADSLSNIVPLVSPISQARTCTNKKPSKYSPQLKKIDGSTSVQHKHPKSPLTWRIPSSTSLRPVKSAQEETIVVNNEKDVKMEET